MTTIGGKTKTKKPTQPQYVVQLAPHLNEFARLIYDEDHQEVLVDWIGDPNAATKFDSKYAAKARMREFEDVPATRCFRELAT